MRVDGINGVAGINWVNGMSWLIYIGKLLVLLGASWSLGSGHYGLSGAMFCAVIAAELLYPTNRGER